VNISSYKWLTIAGIMGITLVGCPKQPEPANTTAPEKTPGVSNEVTITPTAPTPVAATPTPAGTPNPVASPEALKKAEPSVKLIAAGKRLDPFVQPRITSASLGQHIANVSKNEPVMGSLPFTINGILMSSKGNYAILFNNKISKNVIVRSGDYIDQEKQYKVRAITENQVIIAYGKQTEKLTIASFEDKGPYPDRQMKATTAPESEEKEAVTPTSSESQQPSANKSEVTPPPPPPGSKGAPAKPADNGGNIW